MALLTQPLDVKPYTREAMEQGTRHAYQALEFAERFQQLPTVRALQVGVHARPQCQASEDTHSELQSAVFLCYTHYKCPAVVSPCTA
jgi:hypothetical protein